MKGSLGTAQGPLAHRAVPALVCAPNHPTDSCGHARSWSVPPGKDLVGVLLHSVLTNTGTLWGHMAMKGQCQGRNPGPSYNPCALLLIGSSFE